MSWDQLVENVKQLFNQPVVIACCTIGLLFLFVLVVLTKTSLGKKALKALKEGFSNLLNAFNKHKEETEKRITELKDYYEREKRIGEAKLAVLEEFLLVVAENSHNDKIKEAVTKSKEKLSICKTDFESLVEEKILSEKERVITEFKEKYEEFYKSYLSEAKSKVDELVEQAEKVAETVQKQAISMKEEAKETVKEVREVIEDEKVSGSDTYAEEEKTLQD